MARHRSGKLRRGESGASYPTLAEAMLDRRTFLAGAGVAALGACFESSPDDVPLDGARPPADARLIDATSPPDVGNSGDGTPPPPDDAAVDAVPADAISDAAEADAGPVDASVAPDADGSDGAS